MTIINAMTREEAVALAAELERRHKTARDFVVTSNEVEAVETPEGLRVAVPDGTGLGSKALYQWGPTATAQTLNKLNVPGEYGKRIFAGHPALFATTVNTLNRDAKGKSLWRTLDGVARANLSDSFRALDNYDLFFNTYSVAKDSGAEIQRVSLADDRFEMRMIVPDWRETIDYKGESGGSRWFGRGHSEMIPGCYVSNSETGKGGLNVRPFLFDGICSNGMVLESTLRVIHLGGRLAEGYLSREAIDADSRAVWLQVRDLVRAVFDREKFSEMVAAFRATGELRLRSPEVVVDAVVRDAGFTEDDRQAILDELISPTDKRDPGRNVFGLISAITARAKAYEDPERRTDMEMFAGKLIGDTARAHAYAELRPARKAAK